MPLYALDGHAPETPGEGQFWVAPDAHVIGKVVIGADVGIWFGAVIRGDNETITIGPETNIQEHAMLHTDMGFPMILGRGCTIGHGAILHGCVLGDHVLIGMGATVLNGAKIGAGSLVGANALVTEGKEFPPGSLIVGSPARSIRTLDEKALEGLRGSAAGYARNWKRFAAGLKIVG
ncbi:gamma carbonic anhydrase family protein [Rhabdaerophilum sp. SD176]|uniref:gamma carbonic anhydrase family protein n=1 Tax=Rhabdaerophilum sp. SD176 TaxID=2983548 RepID=UPI0024DF43E4|nr:gamma carbonic anhydrase family protein [Rhabdaerophilum sp. SD176]